MIVDFGFVCDDHLRHQHRQPLMTHIHGAPLIYRIFITSEMSSHSTTLKEKGVEVKISARHNKKLQSAVCYVSFDTNEKSLLGLLLSKYAIEKCVKTGVNTTTQIYSAIPGQTGIVLFVPENKLTQNIIVLYNYLQKTKLSSAQAKLCTDGNYKKLSSDLKHFEVTITGKCKNFANALQNKAPKIDRLITSLGAVEPNGNRESISGGSVEKTVIEIDGGDDANTTMLYASIFMGDLPCTIGKNGDKVKITLLGGVTPCCVQHLLLYKDTLQYKVKGFLTQSGTCGSPSSNDKGGVKYAEKCKEIMACQNELAGIYSDVRGFKFSFKNKDELKKVNSESIARVKSIKIK